MTNDDYTDMAADTQYQEDDDIRRAALGFISDAWAEAVAKLAEGLPERILRGDYSVNRVLQ